MKKTILSILLLSSAMTGFSQIITTVAGNGVGGFSGDGGAATAAKIGNATDVAIDASGNLFIADNGNKRIRKVNASTGFISTLAGTGSSGYSGDGGAATAATFISPITLMTRGTDVFVCDYGNITGGGTGNTVRLINSSGTISTYAGTGPNGYTGNGGAATAAKMYGPSATVMNASGELFIGESGNGIIRKVNAASPPVISYVAGALFGPITEGGAATAAGFNGIYALAMDASGVIYVADHVDNRVRKISGGLVYTVAGGGSTLGDSGPATAAKLVGASGLDLDVNGNLYISDPGQNRIRIVNSISKKIYTYAGTGTGVYNGDGINATSANIQVPQGLELDGSGNLYFVDYANQRVRKVSNSAPAPASSTRSITVCQNSTGNSIGALLGASDVLGQTTTWTCSSSRVSIPTASYEATGSSVTPSGVTYTPATGFSGTDNFTVTVSDGYLTSTIVFTVTVTSLPSAGTITVGSDYVCQGTTGSTAWTSSVGGGTWSSSNNSLAYIDAATGVLGGNYGPSTATISYTVTNSCGTGTSTATAHVKGLPTTYGSSNICEGEEKVITGVPDGGTFTITDHYHSTFGWDAPVTSPHSAVTIHGYTQDADAGTLHYSHSGNYDYCAGTTDERTIKVIALPNFTISGTSVLSTGGTCGSTTGSLTITGLTSGDYDRVWTSSDASTISFTATGSPTSGANIAYVTSGTGTYSDLTFTTMGSYCINPTTATYRVTICGAKSGGNESSSNAVVETQKIKIAPNPNNGLFTLELGEANANTSITIMDISGKVLLSKTTNEGKVDFDFTRYSKGIYLITIESGNNKYHEKISID